MKVFENIVPESSVAASPEEIFDRRAERIFAAGKGIKQSEGTAEADRERTLISLPYDRVKLSDGELKEKLREIGEFYLSIPTEDAFYEMRKKAGLDTGAGKSLAYGDGSWFCQGGIVLGQWLQAYARFYRATGDERYAERVREYVGQFDEVRKVASDCCICNTAYMAEKVFQGMMDAVEYCGIERAFEACRALLDNFREIPAIRNAKCRIGDNGGSKDETKREIEWYTLSESLYRFIDMAESRGLDETYLSDLRRFAKKFEYTRFWGIFERGEDMFDYSPVAGQNTAYFHAYSHVNSFNGAMFLYRKTGKKEYLCAALNFYDFMRKTQILSTGGYGAMLEWLMPRTGIVNALRNSHANFENQCNSYACFRLMKSLTETTGRLEFGDQTELLYYNSFLASPETDREGHAFYYSDYCVGGGKKWLHPSSWTCCSGTRPLAALEILRNIYFLDKDGAVYINLYINSSLRTERAEIEIKGNYPKRDLVEISVMPLQIGGKQTIYFRKPAYLAAPAVPIGLSESEWEEEDGSYKLTVPLNGKKRFFVRFPMKVLECDISSCGEGVRAFRYGPLALAAEGFVMSDAPSGGNLHGTGEAVSFSDNEGLRFKPYMDFALGEEYTMYFNIKREDEQ